MTYLGCSRWSLAVWVAVAGLLAGGGAAGVLLPTGAAAGLVAVVWLAMTVRVLRLTPTCPGPGGGFGPGAGGVREPRRPHPSPPGGAVALALPEDPSSGVVSLV
ncbi:hypothetical protein [Streptomyces sp. TLI_146]|uniref:hypothetical protein n=1 Tax=Streptomyces sp. TLI_146 TaxID=1938858 RepID=UPI00117D7588|nr:hypothetical protein [Streptomyces sp. TLI_146]